MCQYVNVESVFLSVCGERAAVAIHVQNFLSTFSPHGRRTWWQSENGVEHVSIRLDLEGEFHFTHLIMKFKTFRPAAMLVERSADFGRSWKVYRYFAYNCSKLFPGVPVQPSGLVDEVLCDQRYSEIEPSSHGEVIFKVLDPSIPVADPYSPDIQDLLRVTNLRVNLTKLHTLGDNLLDTRREVLHKTRSPGSGVGVLPGGELGYRMPCHDTVPAGCDCNEHSQRCHFDMAVFLATGNTSGAVCDGCQHNTMGRHCHLCKPFYYRHPPSDIRAPTACAPCDCVPAGSLDGGACDGHTDVALGMIAGQCRCKENVAGPRCDRCRHGAYGLSHGDPQGCQPCRCDPRGTVAGSSPCDPISGDCYCKRFVAGRSCSECVVKGWMSVDRARQMDGQRDEPITPRCSMEDGACPCRPHLMGRQCNQVQPGFFCAPLDYYTYEAERATGHGHSHPQLPGAIRAEVPQDCLEYDTGESGGRKGRSRHQPHLSPQSTEDWEAVVSVSSRVLPTSPRCGNLLPSEQMYRESLPHSQRYVLLSRPFCFEPSTPYEVTMRLQRAGVTQRHPGAFILIDSLVLLPRVSELPGFHGAEAAAAARQEELERYRCLEAFRMPPPTPLAQACARLVCSVSALLHGGALPCQCDPQGSRSSECQVQGGQCECKPHVLGRRCDRCAPGSYGFGPLGCSSCACSPEGSVSQMCDAVSGQCRCQHGAVGRQCDQCQPGYWGFPACRPCQCNGHAEECDPQTGRCLHCRDHTAGRHCERCQDGYYGDPVRGQCQCRPGFGGRICSQCQEHHWGDPERECRDCECEPLGAESLQCEQASGQGRCRPGFGGPGGPLLNELPRRLDGTRMELDDFWRQVQELEQHLDQLAQADVRHHSRLTGLSHELGALNRTASHLQVLLGTVAAAGFSESYHSILASAEDSRQGGGATAGELSEVGAMRRAAERVLRQRGDAFRRGTAAARKSLREAQKRVMGLSVTRINEKICGAPGDRGCEQAPCGGALCRDSTGTRHCGGTGCMGALPVSARALSSARNTSQQLEVALGQLGIVAQKTQEVQELARGARSRAEEALGRSQAARSRAEKATAQLRDFIRRIKAFLAEEGADPGSIELVARQGLDISLPSSPSRIQELLREMRESIGQLEGVDAVLNSTAQGLAAARGLLAQGQDARERAEGVRDELAGTQRALDAARVQATAAGSTLQSARDAIQAAESRTKEAERRLQALEGKESRAQRRLQELAQRVNTLQEQGQDARRTAQQAKDGAERATAASGTLSQDLAQVTQRYVVLKGRVSGLAGVSGGALQRVTQLTAEAQDLLDKASSSKRKLEELEQHFGANERVMAAKVTRLQALEQRVWGLLEEIRERANAYATC
ncbi:PREDICTED: laminin subunit beta-2-like [Charadrius vociferus]|uniref:laminin subunit beta-2-like n=1 Tax=Charadrius vociferus TaxID=50402 RepID=UPI0005219F7E|nr:PREDICTED: laminin subunit beta-2-like [Charadrius vociferus]